MVWNEERLKSEEKRMEKGASKVRKLMTEYNTKIKFKMKNLENYTYELRAWYSLEKHLQSVSDRRALLYRIRKA